MDPTLDQLVIFAVRGGNLQLVQERVAAGGDLNAIDPMHGSALSEAIPKGDLEILEWMLAHGADDEIVLRLLHAGAKLLRTARPFYRQRLDDVLRRRGQPQAPKPRTP